jgi:hypothetical protein
VAHGRARPRSTAWPCRRGFQSAGRRRPR